MQKSNITLIIGDNAAGKTRSLYKIYEEKIKDNIIVTNIPDKSIQYEVSEDKEAMLEETDMVEAYKEDNMVNKGMRYILRLLAYKGDILMLDNLDRSLTAQQVIDISHIIRENRAMWKEIYITGYDAKLLVLFDGDEENIIVLTENGKKHTNRYEFIKHIDKIRE